MIFLYPYMFFLSFLVFIPLILHFKKKINRKKIYFPYLFLFENEIKNTSKKSKFNKNLLIFLRMLLIFFTIVFFANPVKTISKHKEKNITFFIDNTISLMYKENNEVLIDTLKREIRNIIQAFDNKAIFNIIYANGSIKTDLNKTNFLNQIENITYTLSIITPEKVIQLYDDISKQKKDLENIFILISDFRKNRYKDFYFDKKFFYHKIGSSNKKNVSISNINIFPKLYFNNENTKFFFTLNNFSNVDENITLKLFNEEKLVFEKNYSIKARDKIFSEIPVLLKKNKNNFYFEITSDNFPYDDKYNFSINIFENISVLIIGNNELEKKIIAKAIQSQNSELKKNIIIDFEKKLFKYDITILIGINENQNIEKNSKFIFFVKNTDNIKLINKIFKKFSDAINIIEIKREKCNILEDKNFPLSFNPKDIFFNSYFLSDTFLTSYFSLGKSKLISINKNTAFFLADIGFENSNILFSAFFPIVLDRIIYKLMSFVEKKENFEFKNNENDLLSLNPPEKSINNITKNQKNIDLRYIIFLIIIILFIFETLISFRGLNAKKTIVSR